ncbi:MAG: hypothetical protein KF729_25710 [Sandaracinaceae bacterium]|nr:hypothetical protein [Sandaracinaceae bacterium]
MSLLTLGVIASSLGEIERHLHPGTPMRADERDCGARAPRRHCKIH